MGIIKINFSVIALKSCLLLFFSSENFKFISNPKITYNFVNKMFKIKNYLYIANDWIFVYISLLSKNK